MERGAIVSFLAAGAVLVLLAQTLPYFTNRWVEDESWYSIGGHTLLKEGVIRNPTFAGRGLESVVDLKPPGLAISLAGAFSLLGTSATSARLVSLLLATLAVVVTFRLAREFVGTAWSGVAAFLLVVDSFFFLAARTVRPEAGVAFFGSLSVLLFLRSERLAPRTQLLSLLSGLSMGVALAFHPGLLGVALVLGVCGLFWRKRGRVAHQLAFAAGAGLILAPLVAIAMWTPLHRQAFQAMYMTRAAAPFLDKLVAESTRWADFIGVSSARFGTPIPLPLRLHIAATIACALAVLWRIDRPTAKRFLWLIAGMLVWWLYMVNKSPRYFAMLAPLTAVALATASERAIRAWPRARTTVLAVVGVCFVSQLAGNVYFLHRARLADYSSVGRELRTAIPSGSRTWGAITFWMALHERPYYSWNRTPLDFAIRELKPEYLIINDRVMMRGEGLGRDDWAETRLAAQAFSRDHGDRVAVVDSSFYGSLEVIRVRYDADGNPR